MIQELQALYEILQHFEWNEFTDVSMTLQDAFLAGLCMCSLSKQGAKA